MKTVYIHGESTAYTFPISDSSSETFFMLDGDNATEFDPLIVEAFLKDEWLTCTIETDGEHGEPYEAKLQSVALFYENGIRTNVALRKKTELELLQDKYDKLLAEMQPDVK